MEQVMADLERGTVIRQAQDEAAATWEPSYRAPAFKTMTS
jgi:hypothetical protein